MSLVSADANCEEELDMRRWILSCVFVASLSACGSSVDPQRHPAPADEGDSESIDYCERFGWYGDGRCDEVCANPDPDCSSNNGISPGSPGDPDQPTPIEPDPAPSEPAPVDPDECVDLEGYPRDSYVAFGDECHEIDYACVDGYVPFDNACGCGCVLEVDAGPHMCLADTPDVIRYGDVEECTRIDYACEEGWYAFSDDCGCGCRLECTSNADCPNGYCNFGTDAPQVCVYPSCDDGSELACRMMEPTCEVSETAAIINGCWECVDARSCGPRLGD